MTEPEPPPWQGGAQDDGDAPDPLLEYTVPLPPAPPGFVVPAPAPPADALRSLARAISAGRAETKRRYRERTTVHSDAWMLDAHKAKANVGDFKTDRERIDAELASRKAWHWGTRAALGLALVVTFFVLHAQSAVLALGGLFVVAGVYVARLAWLGHEGAGHPDDRTALPDVSADNAAPETVRLDVETFTAALNDAGFLKDGRAIEVRATRPMANGNGWSCWVTLPANLPATKVMEARHALATPLNTNDQCLILLPSKERNRDLFVWLCDHDPLAGPPVTSAITEVRQIDVWKGVPLGRSVRGEPILANVIGSHWLMAGDPRSGKSFLARLLVSFLAKDPHVQLILMDPDDAGLWSGFGAIGEYIGGSSPDAVRTMADRLHEIAYAEMERRAEVLRRYRAANPMQVTESKITRAVARDPKLKMPLVWIVIDECHVPIRDERVQDALQQIATRGGKFGVGLLLITQYPSTENIPAKVRNIPTTGCCLSVTTGDAAKMVLKEGWKQAGMDPVQGLDPDLNAGAFYLRGPGLKSPSTPWVLGRSDYLDDNEARSVLVDALELRQRARPELLPRKAGDGGGGPEAPAAGVLPPPPPLRKGDPRHLFNLACVFSPDPELRTLTIVERLKQAHSAQYAKLTQRGINAWLKPFKLRTTNLDIGGRSYAGLRFTDVYRRLLELDPGLARELPGMSGTRDPADLASTSERASHLPVLAKYPTPGNSGRPGGRPETGPVGAF